MKFYDKQSRTNFNVGLFVIISLVILIFGYLWLINYLEQGSMTKLTLAFPEIGSLELGDGVLIMGVNRGKVTDIRLDVDRVLVDIAVKLETPLKKDSRFIVKNTSVMGSMRIILKPGKSQELMDVEKIQQGESVPGISEMFTEAAVIIQEVKVLLQRLNSPDNIIDRYSDVADSLKISINKANNIMDNNHASITSAISAINDISQKVSDILMINEDNINNTISNSDELIKGLQSSNNELQKLLPELTRLASRLNSDDSSIGQLTGNDDLYQSLHSTIARMDSLIADMKKNPKKYFKVEVF